MSLRDLDPDGTDSYHPEHPWEQAGHALYLAPDQRTQFNWPTGRRASRRPARGRPVAETPSPDSGATRRDDLRSRSHLLTESEATRPSHDVEKREAPRGPPRAPTLSPRRTDPTPHKIQPHQGEGGPPPGGGPLPPRCFRRFPSLRRCWMASRACLVAVNRTIRAAGLDEAGTHAALIDFARNLARRVDAVGTDEAPLNLLRLYDSAVTKLERAAAPKSASRAARDAGEEPASEPVGPSGPPKLEIVKESALDRIRKSKARAAAG